MTSDVIGPGHPAYRKLWGTCVAQPCPHPVTWHGLQVYYRNDRMVVHGNMFACELHYDEWMQMNSSVTFLHRCEPECLACSNEGVTFDDRGNECHVNWDVLSDKLMSEIEGLG